MDWPTESCTGGALVVVAGADTVHILIDSVMYSTLWSTEL